MAIGLQRVGAACLLACCCQLQATQSGHWVTLLDQSAFRSETALQTAFRMGYPWGSDHNGTAKMVPQMVSLDADGILRLHAERMLQEEEKSSQPPHLALHYRSGAVYWKQQIVVDAHSPTWSVEGEFAVPDPVRGTWPAFWLTAVHGWPPEIDILEFKGQNIVWQNTLQGSTYQEARFVSHTTSIPTPSTFHRYRVVLRKLDSQDVQVEYFVDERHIASDRALRYVGKPLWLIVNLQMEGAAEGEAPQQCTFRVRQLMVKRWEPAVAP